MQKFRETGQNPQERGTRHKIRDTRSETQDPRHETREARRVSSSWCQRSGTLPHLRWWRGRRGDRTARSSPLPRSGGGASIRPAGRSAAEGVVHTASCARTTRETPREFGLRLTLSGFSIETACAISTYLRRWFDPSSPVSARFLRAPVLPFALRSLPDHAAPEGPVWPPPHLAAVRRDSPGSGRPRRPLASLPEE